MTKDNLETKKILLVGFGRMGISHLSILGGLLQPNNIEVHIVDNNLSSRIVAKELIPGSYIYKNVSNVSKKFSNKYFDYSLITTPPSEREKLIKIINPISKNIFIEKPLMMKLAENQMSGYVLQHCPLNRQVSNFLHDKEICKIKASLKTNISFDDIKSGWRSSKFGSVNYEFGGHLLTLIASTCGDKEYLRDLNHMNFKVHRDNRNDVFITFESSGIETSIELIAGSQDVRKASYQIDYFNKLGCFSYDLYSLKSSSLISNDADEVIYNIASYDTKVPFYVRGFEFTNQMIAFISGKKDILTSDQINSIEAIVERKI